jgi:hypothetical protein
MTIAGRSRGVRAENPVTDSEQYFPEADLNITALTRASMIARYGPSDSST